MIIYFSVHETPPVSQRASERNTFIARKLHRVSPELRRQILLISLIFLSVLYSTIVYAEPEVTLIERVPTGNENITWGPYLTNTTQNSTDIHWRTSTYTTGRVDFVLSGTGPSGASSQVISDINASQFHEISLKNLEPGKRYMYCVENVPGNFSFSTLPADGSFRFIVYGDTREQLPDYSQSELHARVAGRIAMEQDCLFVVHTGDLVNDPSDEEEWGRFFNAAGPMLANTTFFPVPGNHEGDLLKYEEYFRAPPWYNFTCAGSEFVILDSNSLPPAMNDEQDLWINQTFSGPYQGRFIFLHHPMYTSEPNHWGGFLDVRQNWERLFVEYHVVGVFSAHVHAYEHFYENGIHYFTMGTGGAPFYPLAKQKPAGYRNSMENTLAYARITVNPAPGPVLIEVIKVAEVLHGQINMYPPETITETIVISQIPGKTTGSLINYIPLSFKSPSRFLNK